MSPTFDLSEVRLGDRLDGSPDDLDRMVSTMRTNSTNMVQAANSLSKLRNSDGIRSDAFTSATTLSIKIEDGLRNAALYYGQVASAVDSYTPVLRDAQSKVPGKLEEYRAALRSRAAGIGGHEQAKQLAHVADQATQDEARRLAAESAARVKSATQARDAAYDALHALSAIVKEANDAAAARVKAAPGVAGVKDSFWDKIGQVVNRIAKAAASICAFVIENLETIALLILAVVLVVGLIYLGPIGLVAFLAQLSLAALTAAGPIVIGLLKITASLLAVATAVALLEPPGQPHRGTVRVEERPADGNVVEILESVDELYDSHDPENPHDRPKVEVRAIECADGALRYVVYIAGTVESLTRLDGYTGSNGPNWLDNIRLMVNGTSVPTQSLQDAIERAIDEDIAWRKAAGKPLPAARPEILMAAHSQGGMMASVIAGNPDFARRFNVTGIITAGSPDERFDVPAGTRRFGFEGRDDVVPWSDAKIGEPSRSGDVKIQVDTDHELAHYIDGVKTGVAAGNGTAEDLQNYRQLEEMVDRFSPASPASPDSAGALSMSYRVEFGRD